MPVNDKQKLITVNIDGDTLTWLNARLQDGYVILSITNLQPSQNKLLIMYATPDEI